MGSIWDTPVRALQQQLSQSVWFHCVCVATLSSWPTSHVYMYSPVQQTTPSHRYHEGCSVNIPPQFNMLWIVELSKIPPSPWGRGSGLDYR